MIVIRVETPEDRASIDAVTRAAFAQHEHGGRIEASVVAALRQAGALTLSLVAEVADVADVADGLASEVAGQAASPAAGTVVGPVAGHVAFSPVRVRLADGRVLGGWYGLGPLSVLPSLQRQGIGSKLIRQGLAESKAQGARGCVVLGEPAYYHRFGFRSGSGLTAEGLPPAYFMSLAFDGDPPSGTVTYHPAFSAGD